MPMPILPDPSCTASAMVVVPSVAGWVTRNPPVEKVEVAFASTVSAPANSDLPSTANRAPGDEVAMPSEGAPPKVPTERMGFVAVEVAKVQAESWSFRIVVVADPPKERKSEVVEPVAGRMRRRSAFGAWSARRSLVEPEGAQTERVEVASTDLIVVVPAIMASPCTPRREAGELVPTPTLPVSWSTKFAPGYLKLPPDRVRPWLEARPAAEMPPVKVDVPTPVTPRFVVVAEVPVKIEILRRVEEAALTIAPPVVLKVPPTKKSLDTEEEAVETNPP